MSDHGIIAAFKAGRLAGYHGEGDNQFSEKGEPLHFAAWEAGFADQHEVYRITAKGDVYRNWGRATLADVWPVNRFSQ